MHTCSNCGTEFDDKYLECPNCGCSRGDIKNAKMHDKRTEKIGGIIAICFIIFLIILISYGTYLLLNPFKDGPTVRNVTSGTTTTKMTESTSSTSTTTKKTEPALVGTEIPFGNHTLTIPEGYYQSNGVLSFTPIDMYPHTDGVWIQGPSGLMYFSIVDKYNFKYNEETSKSIDKQLNDQGYSSITAVRVSGKLCFYAVKDIGNGYYSVILYYNSKSNLLLSSFNIQGEKINSDNMKDVLLIISTLK